VEKDGNAPSDRESHLANLASPESDPLEESGTGQRQGSPAIVVIGVVTCSVAFSLSVLGQG
jgi:hypothetical protein